MFTAIGDEANDFAIGRTASRMWAIIRESNVMTKGNEPHSEMPHLHRGMEYAQFDLLVETVHKVFRATVPLLLG